MNPRSLQRPVTVDIVPAEEVGALLEATDPTYAGKVIGLFAQMVAFASSP